MCVWGWGGGPVTSFKVNLNFPKSRGSNICYRGGGGGGGGVGVKLFPKGGVQLLSDRTYGLYWTPVSAPDPRNYQEF